jgi:hypothetical protein
VRIGQKTKPKQKTRLKPKPEPGEYHTVNKMNDTLEMEVLKPEMGALEAISRAEIDTQISTAKKYPRQLAQVKSSMLSFATLDEETAQSCFYTLPRGGKSIQGPSVRLAEIALSCYGNLKAGTRIIETVTSGPAPHVVVQAVCHDLEKNVAISVEKRRRIFVKRGKTAPDEDDINLAANAGSAIAFRDAVYKVVPLALVKPCYEAAKKVAIGDARTLNDRRARAVEAFGKMGVTPDRVLAVLEKTNIEEVTVADLEILIGLHTAIKDGQTSIEEAFPVSTEPAKPKFSMPEKAEPKAQEPKAEETPAPKAEEKATPAPAKAKAEPKAEAPKAETGTPHDRIKSLLAECNVTEDQLIDVLKRRFAIKDNTIKTMDDATANDILTNWSTIQKLIEQEG